MKTLAERLVWARNKKEMSQAQLAQAAGVSQSTIGNLEAGIRSSARKITSIALALDVDAAWLAEGIGDSARNEDSMLPNIHEDLLPRGAIPVSVAEQEDPNYLEIRAVRLKLSAGLTGVAIDQVIEDAKPILFQREWLEKNGYFAEDLVALKIRGESMAPRMEEGDLVVINMADKVPRDGLVYAVNYEGEDVVKRLVRENREWWLVSDNPDQKTYQRKLCRGASCIIIGQVIHKQSSTI